MGGYTICKMLDRWTDSFFWPALVGAWLGALVAALAPLLGGQVAIITPTTVALAALAAVMFIVMLLDAPTRHAVQAYNMTAKSRWREMTWAERLFSSEYGDRRLLIVNRLVWVELVIFIFADNRAAQLLCFVSFALSAMMLMLQMKRLPK